jgi:hypothetical protein
MPTLIVYQIGAEAQPVSFDQQQITIGRDPTADLTLASRMVSRTHAVLTKQDNGHWSVAPMKAENPLIINGQRISGPTWLQEGTEIQAANYLIVFSLMGSDIRGYASWLDTYVARCDGCDWSGQVGALNQKPTCARCGKEVERAQSAGGTAQPQVDAASADGGEQPSTFYMSEGQVGEMHKQVRTAKLAKLMRLSDDGSLPVHYDLDEAVICTLGKEGKSVVPVKGLSFGDPSRLFYRQKNWWIRKGGGPFMKIRVAGEALVGERKLAEGDEIEIGKSLFRFST